MSYYGTGDYYLAGDPGLFSSIGGFLKTAARGAVGFVTGGPVGAAAAVLPGIVGGRSTSSGAMIPSRIADPRNLPDIPSMVMGPAARGLMIPPSTGTAVAPYQPKGYHLNKTGYFLKSGAYVAPGTKWVKNRTRNFANGRALNRAISRTAGFNRMVKRSRKNLRALAKI